MKKDLHKHLLILVLAVVAAAFGLTGCGSDEQTDGVPEEGAQVEQTEQAEPETTEPEVSKEFQNALIKAQQYSDTMHMSKDGLYDQLTSEYGEDFEEDAAQYAVENVDADWNENALLKAKEYQDSMAMSKSAIYEQLISDAGEKFTEEQAQYAVDNLDE